MKIKAQKFRDFLNKAYPDVMVDLETLDTEVMDSPQVISIGAVRFRLDVMDDEETIADEGRLFYARLNLAEQEENGRSASDDTIDWWSKQSSEAREVFFEEEEDVLRALTRFKDFCKGSKYLWGNGNMFDNTIMRDLHDDYGMQYPVRFWEDLDMRTLKRTWNLICNAVSNKKLPTNEGVAHNALDDAKIQVLQCQKMFQDLKGSKYERIQSAE